MEIMFFSTDENGELDGVESFFFFFKIFLSGVVIDSSVVEVCGATVGIEISGGCVGDALQW